MKWSDTNNNNNNNTFYFYCACPSTKLAPSTLQQCITKTGRILHKTAHHKMRVAGEEGMSNVTDNDFYRGMTKTIIILHYLTETLVTRSDKRGTKLVAGKTTR